PSPSTGARISPEFEPRWRRWLHDGIVPDTAFAPKAVAVRGGATHDVPALPRAGGIELAFKSDPSILDGRFANNGWLPELPKPVPRPTWDNAVTVGPATAERLKATNRPAFVGGEHGQIVSDVVEIRYDGRSVRGALFPVVGHPDDCATIHL